MHPPAYPARPPGRSEAAEDCPLVAPTTLVLEREVSQKKKDKYHILMHICEIRKKKWYGRSYLQSGNRDTDIEKKHMYIKGEGVGWGELGDWDWHICTIVPCVK